MPTGISPVETGFLKWGHECSRAQKNLLSMLLSTKLNYCTHSVFSSYVTFFFFSPWSELPYSSHTPQTGQIRSSWPFVEADTVRPSLSDLSFLSGRTSIPQRYQPLWSPNDGRKSRLRTPVLDDDKSDPTKADDEPLARKKESS